MCVVSLLQAPTENLTAPETGKIVLAYEAGPKGAVFMPAATISVAYPEGTAPGSGDHIAWWNGTSWVKLPSVVNSANASVSASASHFTKFALISTGGATSPASTGIELSELTLTPAGAETLAEITDPPEVDRLAGLCREARPGSATTAFRQVLDQFSPRRPEAAASCGDASCVETDRVSRSRSTRA